MYRCQRGSKFSALQRKSLENFSLSGKIHGRNVPFVKEKSSSPIPQNREICFFPIFIYLFYASSCVNFLNTMLPAKPARVPPTAPRARAMSTLTGGLKANGANSPGIGDAVPGALFTMPSKAAAMPARPPPKKFDP